MVFIRFNLEMWKLVFCVFLFGHVSSEKIIIVGSGAAGIAAASRLLENNITDFRILEAENRVGGRIQSFFIGNAFVDLGAQSIHGMRGNVAYELAKDYVKPGMKISDYWVYYSGRRKTGDNLLETVERLKQDVANSGEFNVSLGDGFIERYNAVVMTKYKNDYEMLMYAKNSLRAIECHALSAESSFSWYKIIGASDYEDREGDQGISWDGLGFKTILDLLLKNFPNKTGYNIDSKISFKKTVSKIILNESGVRVKTEDGTEYDAEYLIFTPSLGVLKHDHMKMFEPGLSSKKVTAIDNLGYDGVMKIILEFPNEWWGSEKNFLFVWTEEERKNLPKEIPYGPVINGDHWLSWFYVIELTPNNRNILIGWIVGPMVPEVEKLSEEEIKNGTYYVMRKFLGKDFNVTRPIKAIHSKWCTNGHFRGSYSYESMNLAKSNINSARNDLLEPISGKDGIPRILFAGEATNPKRFATVDGAIETGYREGDRIRKIMTNK